MIFDFDNGGFIHPLSDRMGMDFDGNMMLRIGDNMAMDLDSGDIHMTSSWPEDEEDDDW